MSILADDVDLLNESNHLYPVVIKANFIPLYTSWIAGFEALLLVSNYSNAAVDCKFRYNGFISL